MKLTSREIFTKQIQLTLEAVIAKKRLLKTVKRHLLIKLLDVVNDSEEMGALIEALEIEILGLSGRTRIDTVTRLEAIIYLSALKIEKSEKATFCGEPCLIVKLSGDECVVTHKHCSATFQSYEDILGCSAYKVLPVEAAEIRTVTMDEAIDLFASLPNPDATPEEIAFFGGVEAAKVEITEVKTTKLKKYVRAINQQHQTAVSQFVYWDTKYNDLVDLDDDKNERKQEKAYNKALDLYSELPAREQKQLNKLVCGSEYYK